MSHSAKLRIKRIYEAPSSDDGARVLVDRLWPRGIKKTDAELTLWLKDIAPSPELRKWFDHDPARFKEFEHHYRSELMRNAAVEQLVSLLKKGHVTLLYAAKDPQCNHAIVLADFLRNKL